MSCLDRHRQCLKKREYLGAILEVSTCNLPDNERMADNMAFIQQCSKLDFPIAEMRNPHRSVNENHSSLPARLRGIVCSSFSVPASLARRLLLSLAISASRPSRTREVFSSMPVNFAAFWSRSSSMFRVVLIGISSRIKQFQSALPCIDYMHFSRETNVGFVEMSAGVLSHGFTTLLNRLAPGAYAAPAVPRFALRGIVPGSGKSGGFRLKGPAAFQPPL